MNLKKCLMMQARAKDRIPGMTQLLSKRPDMFSLGVWPGYYEKAKGVEIQDLDGNTYVDMSISGIGANILGYADPDVDAAVMEAIKKGSCSTLNSPEEIELADLLCHHHPWAGKARFARSGGEAMAVAVRIARSHSEKDKIAFCGYHGWHDWYLAANLGTENALGEHLIAGLAPRGVPKGLKGTVLPFRYNHIEELERIIQENGHELAAIVMEPIRSDPPSDNFLQKVRSIADHHGIVLVFDEISSGFRLNTGGAHLVLDAIPDIAVFSKAMGNGYPIAAIIGKNAVMDAAQLTFISSTMWTERIGPTAALATLKKHAGLNVGEHLKTIGSMVSNGWRAMASEHGLKIKTGGIAPLSHFAFEYENALSMKALFIQLMLEKGFLASTLFYAMYAHQKHHVEAYIDAVGETFDAIRIAVEQGRVETQLKGKPAMAGFKRIA